MVFVCQLYAKMKWRKDESEGERRKTRFVVRGLWVACLLIRIIPGVCMVRVVWGFGRLIASSLHRFIASSSPHRLSAFSPQFIRRGVSSVKESRKGEHNGCSLFIVI